jgi:hypothetical protein
VNVKKGHKLWKSWLEHEATHSSTNEVIRSKPDSCSEICQLSTQVRFDSLWMLSVNGVSRTTVFVCFCFCSMQLFLFGSSKCHEEVHRAATLMMNDGLSFVLIDRSID